jgi:hypothetical protein
VVVVSRTPPVGDSVILSRDGSVEVPRGVGRATLRFDPGPNTTVRTVSADGRVVLHDAGGLDGDASVHLSRYEPTTLRVDAGANATGRVAVSYRRWRVADGTLRVTVDA